ncbi:MAG: OmpP1/FadL family transporter [bacterium]
MKQNKFPGVEGLLICLLAVIVVLVVAGSDAYATNGYFSHGYGMKYKGLAGAGVALHLSPMAAATNPAAMAFVGRRYDVAVAIFNPNREYTVKGAPSGAPGTFGLTPGKVESGTKVFVIPSLAANWPLNEDETFSVGVSLYGNGGMNTTYNANTFFGTSPTGVDLAQLFIAPTFSFLLGERHAFGITPIFAFQTFEARGLQAFGNFSNDPTNLTNNNHNNKLGLGLKVGYLGEWLDFVAVGASFETKVYMNEFNDYAGLFAEQGDFDVPASWTVGVALGFEAFYLVFDVQQMLYSDIASVGNPLNLGTLSPVLPDGSPNPNFQPLGSDNSSGFGWDDMTVFKFGLQLQTGGGWTWRTGYSFGDQPISESEVLFNILAPGVIEQHFTFGFSRAIGDKELNLVVMRAFSESVTGPNPLEVPGQQTIELKMDQWEFGVGLSF